ncbi:MAG: MFS transporter [Acidobacteria bacterium]|nr:MFS transporter [Acidobacteriota bacterium]MBI3424792.1 MFS transporter [Acidobacteriota bacterium]
MSRTILYALTFIALGLITASLGPTLPALAEFTGTTTSQISWLFVARSTGTITGALVLGKLYDRAAGHPLLAGALCTAAAALALVTQLRWLGLLWPVFVLVGLASSMVNVGSHALIARAHGTRVGPHLSFIHFAYGVGGLAAPLLAKPFAGRVDAVWWTYGALAGFVVLTALPLGAVASPPPPPHAHQRAQAIVMDRTIVLLLLFFFLEVSAEGSISGWIFTYATLRGVSTETAFYVNSAFWAAFTLGRLAGIPLALRFSERRIVTAHLLGWLALLALVLSWSNATAALWLCAVGSGLAMAPVYPAMMAWTQRTFHLSGRLAGWVLVASALGAMALPWMIGQLFERSGAQVLLWLVGADLLATLAALAWLLRHIRQQAAEAVTPSAAELLPDIYEP